MVLHSSSPMSSPLGTLASCPICEEQNKLVEMEWIDTNVEGERIHPFLYCFQCDHRIDVEAPEAEPDYESTPSLFV